MKCSNSQFSTFYCHGFTPSTVSCRINKCATITTQINLKNTFIININMNNFNSEFGVNFVVVLPFL